ncbi:MAG: sigma-70 family RNA polymerase sigma factor [Myxococcota bacterium]
MNTNSGHLDAINLTEPELLAHMLEHEARAWQEFRRRYNRLIYRCIQKVTARFRGVIGSEDVEEIYCQLLVNLTTRDMHRLRAFRPERGNKLGSWIGLLAKNAAWDHLRCISRQPQCTELSMVENVSASQTTPFETLIQKERLGIVNQVLQDLSSRDQYFVRLYYWDGLSAEEVAEAMKISVKTVYSKKHKIRCRLERAVSGRELRNVAYA